mmetsp:Transcript_40233/g.89325  ORF Transcript_40233/g.89325 Transcript_40233/m.89325 type:complete len:279 (-) Transcript_40233:982-1818(-)
MPGFICDTVNILSLLAAGSSPGALGAPGTHSYKAPHLGMRKASYGPSPGSHICNTHASQTLALQDSISSCSMNAGGPDLHISTIISLQGSFHAILDLGSAAEVQEFEGRQVRTVVPPYMRSEEGASGASSSSSSSSAMASSSSSRSCSAAWRLSSSSSGGAPSSPLYCIMASFQAVGTVNESSITTPSALMRSTGSLGLPTVLTSCLVRLRDLPSNMNTSSSLTCQGLTLCRPTKYTLRILASPGFCFSVSGERRSTQGMTCMGTGPEGRPEPRVGRA